MSPKNSPSHQNDQHVVHRMMNYVRQGFDQSRQTAVDAWKSSPRPVTTTASSPAGANADWPVVSRTPATSTTPATQSRIRGPRADSVTGSPSTTARHRENSPTGAGQRTTPGPDVSGRTTGPAKGSKRNTSN